MISRRQFLSHSCALGVASATLTTTALQLALARTAAAQAAGGYRALVCILLAGGNDSYNMLVPYDMDQYGEYSTIRADLALPRSALLPLDGSDTNGRQLAVHPGMPELQSLYAAGDVALLANVGTLVEPFDAAAVADGTARLPLGLHSHSDQIAQWQTALPDKRSAHGWGGRMADSMQHVNLANGVSMNISLSGTNVFQSGSLVSEYSIESKDDGAVGLLGYRDGNPVGSRDTHIDGLLAVSQDNVLRREYSRRLRGALDSRDVFLEAMGTTPVIATPFSNGPLSLSLRQIARVIGARDALGATRQTFFVNVGGWDHHDNVLDNQGRMLPSVSVALQEFRDALVELGVFNDVTTFTISDFGRTLTSNGKGSDHGWGGHHIVMGGSVRGAQIAGTYPTLASNSPLDVGRGIYAPTTAVDEYFAELALWFGVAPSDLEQVLPNVTRFYAPGSASSPIGLFEESA